MVGTVNRLPMRCRSIASKAAAQSRLSPGNSTLAAPRATFISAWMPAPCDSGARTSERSCWFSPGSKSARWLLTTKAICPWVSTAAFGLPVVPEVKKNHSGWWWPTCAGSKRPAERSLASDS